ncbi:hypothetical protein [Streptomyces sp. NPDC059010]|uniref:hypothetical protein n=1 Tax=Streptomyces sp. NPDC059010 TaxID=3346695 RepID=UPI0036A92FEA
MLRWTRAAVITLVAALAVLVHHETAAALTHVPPARASGPSSVAGMHNGVAGTHNTDAPATLVHTGGHSMPPGVTDPTTAHEGDGACPGSLMQHCSAAGVDSMKLPPPHQPSTGSASALPPGAAVGRDVPGTAGRAPPDLSVLSRLLL